MKLPKLALAAMLMILSASALAEGGGTFTHQGKSVSLKGAYAYSVPDPFDKSKRATTIVFCDAAIDPKPIDAAADHQSALEQVVRADGRTSVDIIVAAGNAPDGLQGVSYHTDETSSSGGMGPGTYKLELKRNDAKRIEGTFKSTQESDKTDRHGGYYDLHFALDVAGGAK